MSRPDRLPRVAVDFSAPRPVKRAQPLLLVGVGLVALAAIAVAVTQLLLR